MKSTCPSEKLVCWTDACDDVMEDITCWIPGDIAVTAATTPICLMNSHFFLLYKFISLYRIIQKVFTLDKRNK
jgi:hypothetical protein